MPFHSKFTTPFSIGYCLCLVWKCTNLISSFLEVGLKCQRAWLYYLCLFCLLPLLEFFLIFYLRATWLNGHRWIVPCWYIVREILQLVLICLETADFLSNCVPVNFVVYEKVSSINILGLCKLYVFIFQQCVCNWQQGDLMNQKVEKKCRYVHTVQLKVQKFIKGKENMTETHQVLT